MYIPKDNGKKRPLGIPTALDRTIQQAIAQPISDIYEEVFIEKYSNSEIKALRSFANGLERDIDAVENAVAYNYSNGFVEGTNSRLKMIKRTMYGRCGKHLLEAKLRYMKIVADG